MTTRRRTPAYLAAVLLAALSITHTHSGHQPATRHAPVAPQATLTTDTSGWPVTYLHPDTTWTATPTLGEDGTTRVVLTAPGIPSVTLTWTQFRALFTPPTKPTRRT